MTSEGDSGNPLIDPSSPSASPSKTPQSNSESTEELTDNYRYQTTSHPTRLTESTVCLAFVANIP